MVQAGVLGIHTGTRNVQSIGTQESIALILSLAREH